MLGAIKIALIVTTIITSHYVNAVDDVPLKTPVSGSQYYVTLVPSGSGESRAFFMNWRESIYTGGIVAKTSFDCWDQKTEAGLDAMLDLQVPRAKIAAIEIVDDHKIKFDYMRGIRLFDKDGVCIDSASYQGPLDVKNYQEAPGEPYLLRPRSIYSDLKKVTEYTHAISFPVYAGRYPKAILTYQDDGSKIEATTATHTTVVVAKISLVAVAAGLVIRKIADRYR